ncbi:MAG: NAD(P)(+) transhydrogenase (Re/Si-specific) subunit beta [Bacteroidetes bacterium]|nr:NAD(P)(+) transhydrogenase (Re/Si-specific) subunit beta [Bacteroidota bacterium]
MGQHILHIAYLIASITFILGLKMLSNPKTAKRGNMIAAVGMVLGIFATIFLYRDSVHHHHLGNKLWIFGGILIGTIIGWLMAMKVKMTAMPQMVSFFNGMGGACAAIISIVEFGRLNENATGLDGIMNGTTLVILLGVLIGCVSFAGSIIAYLKLEGKMGDKSLPLQQFVNVTLMAGSIALIWYIMSRESADQTLLYALVALSLVYGVLFVLPIGGADMPVVISLLNSFTGMAAAFGGFLYHNSAMLTGGILVGSAGTILTVLMCKAMNRSLLNVILGSFGGGNAAAGEREIGGSIREISLNDAAVLCNYSTKVMIVPGYGLAVAQAQHTCHELEKTLTANGVEVKYAIHPVAGRMPGHMNVLLAEADVSYDKLLEMEVANEDFDAVDVVLVIGANDVVNPAAKTDPASPIYGMPILNVEESKNVIVFKRGMAKGYAGIENELFYHDKTRMLFGDAKSSLEKLVSEVKSL